MSLSLLGQGINMIIEYGVLTTSLPCLTICQETACTFLVLKLASMNQAWMNQDHSLVIVNLNVYVDLKIILIMNKHIQIYLKLNQKKFKLSIFRFIL